MISGSPMASSAEACPSPHQRPEPHGPGRVTAVGGNQRGHGHQVVGVGGVAQAEHECDSQRHE